MIAIRFFDRKEAPLRSHLWHLGLAALIAAAAVALDQLTKYLAVSALYPDGSIDVIKGVFRFTYVENRGAAFGSLTEHRWIFLILSAVLILVLAGYAVKSRPKGWLQCISLGMLIGGGIGNMIDRIALGYVVDFLDFCAFPELWKWVFNGADAFVCVGTAMLMIYIIISDRKTAADGTESDITENEKGGTENDEPK